jgi:hypothetical protein
MPSTSSARVEWLKLTGDGFRRGLAADRYNRNPGGVGATLAKERVAVLHYKVRACAHTLRSPCVCGRGAPADARDAGRVGARMACTRCGTL